MMGHHRLLETALHKSHLSSYTVACVVRIIMEFKKLRRLLQRKRRNEIELRVNLSVLRLFYVGHVVQNRRSALSLA